MFRHYIEYDKYFELLEWDIIKNKNYIYQNTVKPNMHVL